MISPEVARLVSECSQAWEALATVEGWLRRALDSNIRQRKLLWRTKEASLAFFLGHLSGAELDDLEKLLSEDINAEILAARNNN